MSEVKLTKLQRTTLEAAAVRNNHVAWPIRSGKLNPGSEARVIKRLMAMGLVVEKPAIARAPIWREDAQGRPLMAVVNEAGLEAIGRLPGRKTGRRSQAHNPPVAAKQVVVAVVSADEPRRPRAGTKLAVLVELLASEEGATIEEMAAATGWQPHSVRGVMSGMLAKKFAMRIKSETTDGRGRIYRTRDR